MRYGWSLNDDHWQNLRREISGYDWTRTYLDQDYAAQVPSASGVYLICASTKRIPISGGVMEQLYNTIYAGQAMNLQRRFRQHVRGHGNVVRAKEPFRRLDFWFTEVPRGNLNHIEQLLLDCFGPSANIKNVKVRIGDPVPAGRYIGDLP